VGGDTGARHGTRPAHEGQPTGRRPTVGRPAVTVTTA